MPRLWTETIEGHRHEVRQAILDTTAALAGEHGLLSVTMSQIAQRAGIGRATLYKYFSDVEAILAAWHERQITSHLEEMATIVGRDGGVAERLEAALEAYARNAHQSHGSQHGDVGAFMHGDDQLVGARQQLGAMLSELIAAGAQDGDLRDDIPPAELAIYCLHAVAGARQLRSKAAVRRLITVILDGLRPTEPPG